MTQPIPIRRAVVALLVSMALVAAHHLGTGSGSGRDGEAGPLAAPLGADPAREGASVPVEPARADPEGVADEPRTSIGVHGAWRITVYETDGRVAATHAFSNQLLTSGEVALAGILAGTAAIDGWSVTAGGLDSPCGTDQLPASSCVVHDGTYAGPNTAFETLETTADGGTLAFVGSLVAPKGGEITLVGTQVQLCPTDGTGGCVPSGFTIRTGLEPVAVASGQTVELEVLIRFD